MFVVMGVPSPVSTLCSWLPRLPFAVLCVLCLACGSSAPRLDRQDVVLLNIETLRQDVVGAYGAKFGWTPFLDELAARGIVVQASFTVAPWTRPSVASLWTGLYPARHRATRRPGEGVLPPEAETLAEILSSAGYKTFGYVTNSNLAEKVGFAQGFDSYTYVNSAPATAANEAAVKWLRDLGPAGSRPPVLIAIHYVEPHNAFFDTSFTPQVLEKNQEELQQIAEGLSPGEKLAAIEQYGRYIREVDRQISRLLRDLSQLLSENHLVIVTSDHGEEWGDHGGIWHGHSLHKELLAVPLIIFSRALGSRYVYGPVRNIDILPTICEWIGVDAPSDIDGISLARELQGEETSLPESTYAETHFEEPLQAVFTSRHKLIRSPKTGERLLFDLEADPDELHESCASQPVLCEELSEKLASWSRSLRERALPPVDDRATPLKKDKKLLEQLRTLGYVSPSARPEPETPRSSRSRAGPWLALLDSYVFLPPESPRFTYTGTWKPTEHLPSRLSGGVEEGAGVRLVGEFQEAYLVFGNRALPYKLEVRLDGQVVTTIDMLPHPAQCVVAVRPHEGGGHVLEAVRIHDLRPGSRRARFLFDGVFLRERAPNPPDSAGAPTVSVVAGDQ